MASKAVAWYGVCQQRLYGSRVMLAVSSGGKRNCCICGRRNVGGGVAGVMKPIINAPHLCQRKHAFIAYLA